MTSELLEGVIDKHGADRIAGIMLTNPSTLGIFEDDIVRGRRAPASRSARSSTTTAPISTPCWACAGPATWALTWSTSICTRPSARPTAAAGPAAGPIGVKQHLAEFLPHPLVEQTGDGYASGIRPRAQHRPHQALPRQLRGARARLGLYPAARPRRACKRVAEHAILNANYLQARLKDAYQIPYADRHCMHEFVASADGFKEQGVRAMDIAKALLNDGYPRADVLLPADRARGDDDRADGDREPGDARRVRRDNAALRRAGEDESGTS